MVIECDYAAVERPHYSQQLKYLRLYSLRGAHTSTLQLIHIVFGHFETPVRIQRSGFGTRS